MAVLRTERNREQEKEGSSREGESKRETEEACRGGRVNNTRKKEVNGGREGSGKGEQRRKEKKKKKKGKNGAVFTRILWVRLQRPGLGKGFAISAHCRGSPVAFGRQRPGTTARLGGCRDGVAGTALAVPGRSARSDFRQESDLASWAWHRRPRLTEPTAQGTFWKGLRAPPGGAHTQPLQLTPSLCGSHQPRQRQPHLPCPGCGLQNSDPRSLPEPPRMKWRRDLPRKLPRGCVVSSRIALDPRGLQEPALAGPRQLLPIYGSVF